MGSAIRSRSRLSVPGAGLRVVLADDHPVLRQAVRELLLAEGFDVVAEASNGEEAVRHCALLWPEIAIVDLSMPVLNGIEAAAAITRATPRTRVVLFTSFTEETLIEAGRRAGVRGYVSKSDAIQDLPRAVRAVHGGRTFVSRTITPA